MWAVLVVVLDEVVEEVLELSLVPDQGAIQEFVADGSNPSFSECVRLWRFAGCRANQSRSVGIPGQERWAELGHSRSSWTRGYERRYRAVSRERTTFGI